jgi:UDP-glucuronate decarboxylase
MVLLIKLVTGIYDADGYEMYQMRIRSERVPVVGDKVCLTEDHEVLTTSGWIPIAQVTLNHQVATLQSDGSVEYVNPLDTIELDYNGKLYKLRSQQVDLTTTMDHKMYIKRRGQKNFELINAKDMVGKRVRFKKDGYINKPRQEYFIFNYDNEELKIKMDDWLKFLGIWISDGCLGKDGYKICHCLPQRKRKVDRIYEVCGIIRI